MTLKLNLSLTMMKYNHAMWRCGMILLWTRNEYRIQFWTAYGLIFCLYLALLVEMDPGEATPYFMKCSSLLAPSDKLLDLSSKSYRREQFAVCRVANLLVVYQFELNGRRIAWTWPGKSSAIKRPQTKYRAAWYTARPIRLVNRKLLAG